jgi:glycerate kinase
MDRPYLEAGRSRMRADRRAMPAAVGDAGAGPVGGRPMALAAPDAFKGTATASEIAGAVDSAAAAAGWACDRCPLSDGGEGFAAVMAEALAENGCWVESVVEGPLGEPVAARWWLAATASGTQAVIESAAASGLWLAGGPLRNDPAAASTRGTGELIVEAARLGARRVLLGVGGSATTDGGLGALEAIDGAGGLGDVELVVACDVDTPFLDAARVFGPQKGADAAMVSRLSARLEALAATYRDRSGTDVTTLSGGGAAGGLAGGLAVAGARLVPGFEVVAEATGLRRRLASADLVVTGEGRLDPTSWSGKVVGGVAAAAAEPGVEVVVVAGAADPSWRTGLGAVPAPTVIDLTARFGTEAAHDEPSRCVTEIVAAELRIRSV